MLTYNFHIYKNYEKRVGQDQSNVRFSIVPIGRYFSIYKLRRSTDAVIIIVI